MFKSQTTCQEYRLENGKKHHYKSSQTIEGRGNNVISASKQAGVIEFNGKTFSIKIQKAPVLSIANQDHVEGNEQNTHQGEENLHVSKCWIEFSDVSDVNNKLALQVEITDPKEIAKIAKNVRQIEQKFFENADSINITDPQTLMTAVNSIADKLEESQVASIEDQPIAPFAPIEGYDLCNFRFNDWIKPFPLLNPFNYLIFDDANYMGTFPKMIAEGLE